MNNNKHVFLIGAHKSGSSSLYDCLSTHSQICAPSQMKDYPFFLKEELYKKGVKAYEENFGKKDSTVYLSGDVHYMFFESAISKIDAVYPDAKYIIILRNPIERALSSFNYAKKNLLEVSGEYQPNLKKETEIILTGTFEQKCECTHILHSLYWSQISKLLNKIRKEKLYIVVFEDLITRPSEEILKILTFLDVSTAERLKFGKVNTTGSNRSKVAAYLLSRHFYIPKSVMGLLMKIPQMRGLARMIKRRLIILNTRKSVPQDNQISARESLCSLIVDDTIQLSKFLGRNLTELWGMR
jgi:hypothetical protein